jgi:hypothetical protein
MRIFGRSWPVFLTFSPLSPLSLPLPSPSPSLSSNFYGINSNICQRFPIGLIDTVSKFTAQDVVTFLNKWYHPERTHIMLTGDFKATTVVKLLEKTFGHSTRGDKGSETLVPKGAAGRSTPASHPSYIEHSNNVFAGEKKHLNATTTFQIHNDVLNHDGIEFRITAADPVQGTYYNTSTTNTRALRNVHETLYSYVYAHMVYESISDRYAELDASNKMLDYDISSSLNDDFDRNSRYHSWKLSIGNGFGGEKGASAIESIDNQWRTEFEQGLVELKRLALFGPEEGLLDKGMKEYKSRNQKRTDTFYTKSSSDVVAEMYGDRSAAFVWRSPWEIEQDEAAMVHPSMAKAASSSIQAEATFVWETIQRVFQDDDAPLPPSLEEDEGRARPSPFAVFTVIHDTTLRDAPKYKTLQKIVQRVQHAQHLQLKIGSLETVASDTSLLEDQEEDSNRIEMKKRKYVDKTKLIQRKRIQELKTLHAPRGHGGAGAGAGVAIHKRTQTTSGASSATLSSSLTSLLSGGSKSIEKKVATAGGGGSDTKSTMRGSSSGGSGGGDESSGGDSSGGDSSGGDSSGGEDTSNYLVDVDKLLFKKTAMVQIYKGLKDKKKKEAAIETEKTGALLVKELHGIKKYKLLNGIGVNLISVVKGKDEGGKGGKESNLPTGPKGQISMEIVSIGGKSTL